MASALISSVFAQKKNPLRVHAKEAGGVKTKAIFLIDEVVFFYSSWDGNAYEKNNCKV